MYAQKACTCAHTHTHTHTHLHDVHHALQIRHTHVLPAEVEEADLGGHETLRVIAEATPGQVAWPTVVVLPHLFVECWCD